MKASLSNGIFTTGITKDYTQMLQFISELAGVVDAAVDIPVCEIFKLDRKMGPYTECIWYDCIVFYNRKKKRAVLLSVMKFA